MTHNPPPNEPTELYLVALFVGGDAYLLACKDKSLNVWTSFIALSQSVSQVFRRLGALRPQPVKVSSQQHPSILDYQLDSFMLEVSGKSVVSEILLKEIVELGLFVYQVDSDLLDPYLL